jgi:simple sugar transport system ATP-binding protein
MSIALKIKNISKSFPGVLANDNIDINIPEATIHAIVGENGAGKSRQEEKEKRREWIEGIQK